MLTKLSTRLEGKISVSLRVSLLTRSYGTSRSVVRPQTRHCPNWNIFRNQSSPFLHLGQSRKLLYSTPTRQMSVLVKSLLLMAHTGGATLVHMSVTSRQRVYKALATTGCMAALCLLNEYAEAKGKSLFTRTELAPITQRPQSFFYHPEDFVKKSLSEMKKLDEAYREYTYSDDTPIAHRAKMVLLQLLKANPEISQLKNFEHWNVKVIKDYDCNNAWMLTDSHDGYLFTFSGLMQEESDNKLAAYMGAEIAESIMNHKAELESYKLTTRVKSVLPVPALWSVCTLYMVPAHYTLAIHLAYLAVIEFFFVKRKKKSLKKEATSAGLFFAETAGYHVEPLRKVVTKKSDKLFKPQASPLKVTRSVVSPELATGSRHDQVSARQHRELSAGQPCVVNGPVVTLLGESSPSSPPPCTMQHCTTLHRKDSSHPSSMQQCNSSARNKGFWTSLSVKNSEFTHNNSQSGNMAATNKCSLENCANNHCSLNKCGNRSVNKCIHHRSVDRCSPSHMEQLAKRIGKN